MLTVVEETLVKIAAENGREVSVHLYGQEVNPETFAISEADLILKGEGGEAENMTFGSTLSGDAFPSREFDFMLMPVQNRFFWTAFGSDKRSKTMPEAAGPLKSPEFRLFGMCLYNERPGLSEHPAFGHIISPGQPESQFPENIL